MHTEGASAVPNEESCTAIARNVAGLLGRNPPGLKRPSHEHPSLGRIEQVSSDGSRFWCAERQMFPLRTLRIDRIVSTWDEPNIASAIAFLETFERQHRSLREAAVRSFCDPNLTPEREVEVIAHLDDWMTPWMVERWDDTFNLHCDCRNAPDGRLAGAEDCVIFVDADNKIQRVQWNESIDFYRLDIFRLRHVPEECGYVVDCVADRLIFTRKIKWNDNLRKLLIKRREPNRPSQFAAGEETQE